MSQVFVVILQFSKNGALFLFGETLVNSNNFGAIFAFQILPTIVFFSALTSLLFYFGILYFSDTLAHEGRISAENEPSSFSSQETS